MTDLFAPKAADAFRTISEVSEELDIRQHVLRFWESKFSQLRPLKRSGGRRYYRPEDVDLIRTIKRLLHDEGYTIAGAQKLLRTSRSKKAEKIAAAVVALAEAVPAPVPVAAPVAQLAASAALTPAERRQRLTIVLEELKALRETIIG